MSHYISLVMLNEEEMKDIEGSIENKLLPYSENIEVPEYDEECYCKEHSLLTKVRATLKEEGQMVDEYRESFKEISDALLEKNLSSEEMWEERGRLWREHISPYINREKELLEKFADTVSPKEDCDECDGTGYYKSTYNPDSKWDWYVVGGRWNGYFNGKNTASVKEAKEMGDEAVPFALLSPDGWHEKGKMLMFGMTRGEKEQDTWNEDVYSIYDKYPDHYLVAVDCHI